MDSEIIIEVLFTSESGFNGYEIGATLEKELGLEYRPKELFHRHHYAVVDKEKFFIAVVKYGITYEIFRDDE